MDFHQKNLMKLNSMRYHYNFPRSLDQYPCLVSRITTYLSNYLSYKCQISHVTWKSPKKNVKNV